MTYDHSLEAGAVSDISEAIMVSEFNASHLVPSPQLESVLIQPHTPASSPVAIEKPQGCCCSFWSQIKAIHHDHPYVMAVMDTIAAVSVAEAGLILSGTLGP
jgi:hypothetical protein